MTTARATRGARGVGEEGGAAQGGPTARRPTDRIRPRRAGPAGPGRGRRANAGAGTGLERQGLKPIHPSCFDRYFYPKI
jgi:hypothetical protein